MIAFVAIFLGLSIAPEPTAQSLERIPHQHTIYTLRGDELALKEFDTKIGKSWSGGLLLKDRSDDSNYVYWAYSLRSASQARAFLIPAASSNLKFEIKAYSENEFFPDKRTKLDKIASGCGAKRDPFIILPTATLALQFDVEMNVTAGTCISKKVRQSSLFPPEKIVFFGNEKDTSEESKD